MRYKTDIVNIFCKYITHQQKFPQRDLKSLTSADYFTDVENGVLSSDVSNIISPGHTLTTTETNNVLSALNQNYNNQQVSNKQDINFLLLQSSGSLPNLPSILENHSQIGLEPSQDQFEKFSPNQSIILNNTYNNNTYDNNNTNPNNFHLDSNSDSLSLPIEFKQLETDSNVNENINLTSSIDV